MGTSLGCTSSAMGSYLGSLGRGITGWEYIVLRILWMLTAERVVVEEITGNATSLDATAFIQVRGSGAWPGLGWSEASEASGDKI